MKFRSTEVHVDLIVPRGTQVLRMYTRVRANPGNFSPQPVENSTKSTLVTLLKFRICRCFRRFTTIPKFIIIMYYYYRSKKYCSPSVKQTRSSPRVGSRNRRFFLPALCTAVVYTLTLDRTSDHPTRSVRPLRVGPRDGFIVTNLACTIIMAAQPVPVLLYAYRCLLSCVD